MMRKKIISSLMIIIVIVLSYVYAHIDKNSYVYDRQADTNSFYGTGVLKEGSEIRQTFIAQEDTIDGVNVKATILGNVENIVVHYVLLDEASQEVCKGNVSGNELENNKFSELKFKGISGTKGKEYTLVLCEENSDEQNGIGFYVSPDSSKETKLTVEDKNVDGYLVTRVISHGFDLETFVVLLGMITFVVAFMKILYKFFR